jgi:type IV pilus assembly protein PilB
MAKPLLGEMLVENGVITQEQLNGALEVQKTEGGLIGIILVSQGIISEQKLVEYLALQAKIVTSSE